MGVTFMIAPMRWCAIGTIFCHVPLLQLLATAAISSAMLRDVSYSWRALPRLNPHAAGPGVTPLLPCAQALVLRKPLPKENQPLLDISWPFGTPPPSGSAEPGPDAQSLDLRLPAGVAQELTPVNGIVTLPLNVSARASGTLTLTATGAYKEKTA